MKLVLMVVGGLFVLLGAVWILQGVGILPGSFMTGQTKWAVIGLGAALLGFALIWFGRRRA